MPPDVVKDGEVLSVSIRRREQPERELRENKVGLRLCARSLFANSSRHATIEGPPSASYFCVCGRPVA